MMRLALLRGSSPLLPPEPPPPPPPPPPPDESFAQRNAAPPMMARKKKVEKICAVQPLSASVLNTPYNTKLLMPTGVGVMARDDQTGVLRGLGPCSWCLPSVGQRRQSDRRRSGFQSLQPLEECWPAGSQLSSQRFCLQHVQYLHRTLFPAAGMKGGTLLPQ